MDRSTVQHYRDPYTGEPLLLEAADQHESEVVSGQLMAPSGGRYEIRDGIPHLFDRAVQASTDAEEQEVAYYEKEAESYDEVSEWIFASFYEDENAVRERMVDLLELQHDSRVLEVGCGTCRDSIRIAGRLSGSGHLFLQDLSSSMIAVGRRRLAESLVRGDAPQVALSVGNAAHLPFPDQVFDAVFHFGGLNVFSDKRQALAEMARVARVGGKVVVGDESVGPWLRDATYGRILMNSSALYKHHVPLELLPVSARDVTVRWIIGSAYYLIDFRVGEGEPRVDLDKPILGRRGGTHRSRYYGAIEAVTPASKELLERAAAREGISYHAWLERAIRRALEPREEG